MSVAGVIGRAALKKELAPYLEILVSFKRIMENGEQYRTADGYAKKRDHLELGILTMEHLISLMPMPRDTEMVINLFCCVILTRPIQIGKIQVAVSLIYGHHVERHHLLILEHNQAVHRYCQAVIPYQIPYLDMIQAIQDVRDSYAIRSSLPIGIQPASDTESDDGFEVVSSTPVKQVVYKPSNSTVYSGTEIFHGRCICHGLRLPTVQPVDSVKVIEECNKN